MKLITQSGLNLSVENLAFQVNDVFSGRAFASGFDSLIVGDTLTVASMSELSDLTSAALYAEITNTLDVAAQMLANNEQAQRMEERAAYRVACHG